MSDTSLSRRDFFRQLGTGAALGITTPRPSLRPAWIIVARGWQYNDEFAYHEGQYPQAQFFDDWTVADTECRRLCEEFFSSQTPVEFEIDWETYFPDRHWNSEFDETAVTWDEVRMAGFPDPYAVLELTPSGDSLS